MSDKEKVDHWSVSYPVIRGLGLH